MVRFFTQLCPRFALRKDGSFMRLCPACLSTVQRNLIPFFAQTRAFSEKGPERGSSKEESEKIKMPGFTHPETLKEEGYFTEKAKRQLEALKKNKDKESFEKPVKKP